ncbi:MULTISPECIES: GNAT family N-acetyltransferase [unclassified Paenibacillus]|uniref:GNAT family N-acetyltransferase n=1 Tax=unclassified Paenibacillus TaxID=185978 RepID=UPI001AEA72F4|nr:MULTISPECIES: GNAT family N-acetyltransferase [unclassified Paenibacillus]MBP1157093.1 putative acetyltransferase [Paenibacillus sp. PvP091]MBP1172168.1 putative acetyltransferase [Paenibacillus sp. PvR098]MBP2438549.1 putative acetyltransferase [Paenibacillus sp. PvP052]
MNGNVEIRNIPSEHFAESLELSEFAFQNVHTSEERERRIGNLRSSELWGAYVDGLLAAKMTVLDLKTRIQGKTFGMGGIAGVATWPEYRRGGLVAHLLDHALRVMRDNGQTISLLHPFQFAFYRKYGWETYTEYKMYEIPSGLLPKIDPQPGRIVRVGQDLTLLGRIYEQYASRYNGALVRDETWWRDRIFADKQGTVAVYYDMEGEPAGYVFYQVKERLLKVHELVSLHHGARMALWRFLADHDSMIDKLVVNAPADDRLPFLLDNPRVKQELVPYFMARIVDAARFLEKYPFASGTESSLLLEVTDSHAEWNNRMFAVTVDESGTARVSGVTSTAGDWPLVRCDIQTLTAMLMGYQRPGFLLEIGRLQCKPEMIETLERLVPVRQTYLPDFF